VRELVDAVVEAGQHDVVWDGLDSTGRPAASGVYLYRFSAPDHNATRKMIVLK
jgi:hypothetical protein